MFKNLKLFVLLAAALGAGVGAVTSMQAQSWPNQCYSSSGSGCPVCGSGCLGGDYLCCNNGGVQIE